MRHAVLPNWRSLRTWSALLVLIGAYFLQDPFEALVVAPIKQAADLHMVSNGEMSLAAYATLMVVRLVWDVLLLGAIWAALGRPFDAFPVRDRRGCRRLAIGLLIGLTVMVVAILLIVVVGDASFSYASQPAARAMTFGGGWLLADFVGALGEELYGRAAILLVAERFFGWKGAVVMSGLMFVVVHLWNPGASAIWLVRLGIQGALLAYAVYGTGSLWWSVGYHLGWNWASAPLFGAAGSGYLDQGHLFDFVQHGSPWITGGSVGPEGSVFAFLAVLAAFVLLLKTTRPVSAKLGGKTASRWAAGGPELS